ncbi:MAG: TRAP transporter substrate-binding protein [Paracoccus denitrificans]|uniref:TRAP transporter substrate-binding protein n=1 Tax=Paracoccus denitrificans TaxID=266 RepID=A0A533ICL7_PARDE|nr:MAG: TRAP transporter substrate-binding protein [Paracoccus denitrificans]
MTKLNRRQFTTLAAAGLLAAPALRVSAADAEITLKLGHLANEQNSWHLASLKFGEELARLTDGRIQVQVFANESLGKEIDLINGMQLGTADMTITGESLQNWAPMAALLAVPYAYQSLEGMDEVASGEIGDQIEAEILAKAQIRPIGYFARGPRNLTSNREIVTPEDLQGLKLRVPNVPLFVKTWEALGAAPTPMAFGEVFTSLQNGTIDAQENPLALIESANFNEVQKFVNKTEHVRSWIYMTISELTWGRLSEADQQAVMEAAEIAQGHERELFLADEERLAKSLQDKGMVFVDSDTAAFASASRDAVLGSVAPEIKPIVEQLFAEQS